MIKQFTQNYGDSISSTCRLLGFSRQVYYRSIRSRQCRKDKASRVVELVQSIRKDLPRVGTRKLYHLLKEDLKCIKVGRDQLFTILKANHMLITPKRSYHVTTNSHHRFRKHKNLVSNIYLNRPEQVWVSDITYVGHRQNPMYLSLITDAYSKKIVGYDVSNTLAVEGSLAALKKAIKNRTYPSEELIHHSDRGFQYCSDAYQKVLSKSKIVCSMTESYDPYENAIAERVNGILKQEFLLNTKQLSIKIMKKLIKEVIERYNNKRPHWSCEMLTPAVMHQQNQVIIKTYKTKYSRELQLSGV